MEPEKGGDTGLLWTGVQENPDNWKKEKDEMRKEFLVALALIAFVFGTVGMANAGLIAWKILEDSAVAGDGPYSDNLVGHLTDSSYPPDTYEKNRCNLTGLANCETLGAPAVGSYSFVAMDLHQDKTCGYLHDDPNGGKNCTDAGDCPGAELGCVDCTDDKVGWSNGYDSYSYFGNTNAALGPGTFYTCQASGSSFTYAGMNIGTSESVQGLGFGCLNLASTGGGGGTTPCGAGLWSSNLNVDLKVALCLVTGGTIPGITLNGRVYKKGDTVTTAVCNYTTGEISTLLGKVPAGGQYMLVACDNTLTLPAYPTTKATCLAGANVYSRVSAWTANDMTDCSTPCSPPPTTCAGGEAE
jgi:hypothetical protein